MEMVTDVRSICAHLRAVERGDQSPKEVRGVGPPLAKFLLDNDDVAQQHGLSSDGDGPKVPYSGDVTQIAAGAQSLPTVKQKHTRDITLCGIGMGGWLALMCAQHIPSIGRVVMLGTDSDPIVAPVAERLLFVSFQNKH